MEGHGKSTGGASAAEDAAVTASLLDIYWRGWFPMADGESGEVGLYEPKKRGAIWLRGELKAPPRSLRQRVVSGRFVVTSDVAFERVMRECASPRPGRETTWLNEEIMRVFGCAHRAGCAHSVEAWVRQEDGTRGELVGGLYGLIVSGVFAGESMFCRPEAGGTDASKVCLVHLIRHLVRRGFLLLDAQMMSPNIKMMGGVEITTAVYRKALLKSASTAPAWGPFEPERTIEEVKVWR